MANCRGISSGATVAVASRGFAHMETKLNIRSYSPPQITLPQN